MSNHESNRWVDFILNSFDQYRLKLMNPDVLHIHFFKEEYVPFDTKAGHGFNRKKINIFSDSTYTRNLKTILIQSMEIFW